MNKSELVRNYLQKNPSAKPKEVSAALKTHRIAPAYVSNIKLKLKKGEMSLVGGGARGGQGDPIVAAAHFIRTCGGIEEARRALETATRIAQMLD